MDMRETLQRAVDMVFREVPFSRRNDEFKEEVLESAFRKYQTSRSEGATEAEAAGEILVHSGNVEEICRYLEIEKTGDVPAGGPDGERDGGETCDSRNRVVEIGRAHV